MSDQCVEVMIKSLTYKQQQQQAINGSASDPGSASGQAAANRPRANGIVFDEFISVCVRLQVTSKEKKKRIAVLFKYTQSLRKSLVFIYQFFSFLIKLRT